VKSRWPYGSLKLAAGLNEVLDEHRVEVVAVEQIYSHYQRPRTAILMAHARGVILLESGPPRPENCAPALDHGETACHREWTGVERTDATRGRGDAFIG